MKPVTIYDTTLRDGTQGTGIAFSVLDKIRVAEKLDMFGVDFIATLELEDERALFAGDGAAVAHRQRTAPRRRAPHRRPDAARSRAPD